MLCRTVIQQLKYIRKTISLIKLKPVENDTKHFRKKELYENSLK